MKEDIATRWVGAVLVGAVLVLDSVGTAAEATKTGEFSKPVIDIGIVVRDAAASAKFYTNAIGFTEVQGFPVSGELGRKIGLIDGYPVNVRVFVLGQGDLATRIKLLSFPDAQGKTPDQKFIHSTLGIRYLTIYVSSIEKALERLRNAAVKPIGETPVDLGGGTKIVVVRDPDGNFIELIGPERSSAAAQGAR